MLTDGRTDGRMNGRTDERTNGRKLAHLCLPAKAGATTIPMSHLLLAADKEKHASAEQDKATLPWPLRNHTDQGNVHRGSVTKNLIVTVTW